MMPGSTSLTTVELNMQKAALQGHYEAFFDLLSFIKKEHQDNISKDLAIKLFINNKEGNLLLSLLEMDATQNPALQAIVLEILNICETAGLNTSDFYSSALSSLSYSTLNLFDDDMLYFATYPKTPNAPNLFEWGRKYNAHEILKHRLTQEQMYINQIYDLYFSGNDIEARALYQRMKKEINLKANQVYTSEFISDNLPQYFPREKESALTIEQLDNIFVDLLHQYEISIPFIYNEINQPRFYGNNFLTLKETFAFKMYEDISSLKSTAPQLIQTYLENIPDTDTQAEFATEIMNSLSTPLFNVMGQIITPHAQVDIKQKNNLKEIISILLKFGAQCKNINTTMHGDNITMLCILHLDADDGALFDYPGTTKNVKDLFAYSQKESISRALTCVSKENCPFSLPNLKILKKICKQVNLNKQGSFTIENFISFFEPALVIVGNPDTKEDLTKELDLIFKAVQCLMEYGLIQDMHTIQPGTHFLNFIDPETKSNYDLHKFIMQQPSLLAGFMVDIRDSALSESYSIIKGLVNPDDKTQKELNDIESESREKPILHGKYGEYKYKLTDIVKLMKENPNIGLQILKELDPSLLSSERRLQTMMNLEKIAKNKPSKK